MKTIKYISLIFVAFILLWILSPIAVMLAFVYKIIFGGLSDYFKEIAISLDKFGNVVCEILFRIALIKKDGYQFGSNRDTVSEVLGYNKRDNTLTLLGKILVNVLNFFDPNHVEKAIRDK